MVITKVNVIRVNSELQAEITTHVQIDSVTQRLSYHSKVLFKRKKSRSWVEGTREEVGLISESALLVIYEDIFNSLHPLLSDVKSLRAR